VEKMLIDVYAAECHYEKALGICYRQRYEKQCFDEPESGNPGSSGSARERTAAADMIFVCLSRRRA